MTDNILVPPPLPPKNATEKCKATFSAFLFKHYWRLIAVAVFCKITAYLLVPQPPSTLEGHIGALLREFIVFGVTLSVVAFLVSRFFGEKLTVFKTTFAVLFVLACVLNLATAPVKRHLYTTKAHTVFEALMNFEDNPLLVEEYTSGSGSLWTRVPTGRKIRRNLTSDAEKYFCQSYCYSTGYDGYKKDITKAVELCKEAAAQQEWTASSYEQLVIKKARETLNKAGLSWSNRE